MTNQDDNDFSGIWHCCYWFPSNQRKGEEDISEYYAKVQQRGNKLILESLPNQEESYMLVRMTVEGDLATGVWEEHTSPTGEFAGAIYSGALQLIVDKNKKRMEGKWVGVGQEGGKRQIYTGRWELARAGAKTGNAQQTSAT